MNDPIVNVWIIPEIEGVIISAHCSGCKAGLAESCLHVPSTITYIKCWARINGTMACRQVKCSWLLPTYMNEVTQERVADIDFTLAKFVPVQQQLYNSDHGVFAIGFAVCFALGTNPTHVTFGISKLHPDLATYLKA